MPSLSALQALVGLAVLVVTGLAVLGQVRWRATQEWEALAEARLQRIEALEKEVQSLKAQVAEVTQENDALQRLCARLQRQIDGGAERGRLG